MVLFTSPFPCCPLPPMSGSILGSGDEEPAWRSEAEEGAGASVQPSARRVWAHPIRDAHGWHPVQTLQTAQSHGQCLTTNRNWCLMHSSCLLHLYMSPLKMLPEALTVNKTSWKSVPCHKLLIKKCHKKYSAMIVIIRGDFSTSFCFTKLSHIRFLEYWLHETRYSKTSLWALGKSWCNFFPMFNFLFLFYRLNNFSINHIKL